MDTKINLNNVHTNPFNYSDEFSKPYWYNTGIYLSIYNF